MIEFIKHRIEKEKYHFTIHGLERCAGRGISPEEVKEVILSGQVIETYPKDKYGPSCLIWGNTRKGKILHVQCSIDPVWIITTYDPTLNPDEWEDSFKVLELVNKDWHQVKELKRGSRPCLLERSERRLCRQGR